MRKVFSLHRVIKIFQVRHAADGVDRVLNLSHRTIARLHEHGSRKTGIDAPLLTCEYAARLV